MRAMGKPSDAFTPLTGVLENVVEGSPFPSQDKKNYGSIGGNLLHGDFRNAFRAFRESQKGGLGLFGGVMIPCMLGIFGVILFERLGWCIGESGLIISMCILLAGYTMVTLTTLSLSAIVTNGEMKGGGMYFVISRSLGPEFGGALGLVFYAANIAGVGLYNKGFVEAIKETFKTYGIPSSYWWGVLYGSALLGVCFIICLVGASMYSKSASIVWLVLMFSIVFGLISFWFQKPHATKGFTGWSIHSFVKNYKVGKVSNIHTVFAVFFPAVTGMMAGANMSGDLKNPSKDIPRGTLMALGFSALFYSVLLLSMAATVNRDALANNYFIMQNAAFVPGIVAVGVLCSTFASGLSALIGATRIFQAVAKDRLLPFSRFFGNDTEARRELIVSWALVQATVFVPDLNTLATILTMFFLLSYAGVNIACLTLCLSGAVNFRPSFKFFNRYTAALGALICIAAMFYVSYVYAPISLLVLACVYLYIAVTAPAVSYGDFREALIYHQVRKYLLRLDKSTSDVKYWRPQILLLAGNPRSSSLFPVLTFLNKLKKGGLFIVGDVLVGDRASSGDATRDAMESWEALVKAVNLKAFVEVVLSPSMSLGAQNLIMTAGMGALKPNTVAVNQYMRDPEAEVDLSTANLKRAAMDRVREALGKFPDMAEEQEEGEERQPTSLSEYVALLWDARALGKNILVMANFGKMDMTYIASTKQVRKFDVISRAARVKPNMTIDAWIVAPDVGDTDTNLGPTHTLVLLLSHVLSRTHLWKRHARLRVLSHAPGHALEHQTRSLGRFLDFIRIDAEIVIVPTEEFAAVDGARFSAMNQRDRCIMLNKLISSQSSSELTGVVFCTLPSLPTHEDFYEQWVDNTALLTAGLPPTVLVHGVQTVLTNDL